ncbi:unnamed protein product [Lasius platythorax]|uniref:Uncharacterized protein n=1 Tax=Lasius platythorax TaxID=488582 RepID=A0AAV2NPP0_9HYME
MTLVGIPLYLPGVSGLPPLFIVGDYYGKPVEYHSRRGIEADIHSYRRSPLLFSSATNTQATSSTRYNTRAAIVKRLR